MSQPSEIGAQKETLVLYCSTATRTLTSELSKLWEVNLLQHSDETMKILRSLKIPKDVVNLDESNDDEEKDMHRWNWKLELCAQRQSPKMNIQDLQIAFVLVLYTVCSSLYYIHSDQVGCQTCLKIQLNKLVQRVFHQSLGTHKLTCIFSESIRIS